MSKNLIAQTPKGAISMLFYTIYIVSITVVMLYGLEPLRTP
jgi:hypothetical protein